MKERSTRRFDKACLPALIVTSCALLCAAQLDDVWRIPLTTFKWPEHHYEVVKLDQRKSGHAIDASVVVAFNRREQATEETFGCRGAPVSSSTEVFITREKKECLFEPPSSSYSFECTESGGLVKNTYPSTTNCQGWRTIEWTATGRCFFEKKIPIAHYCPDAYQGRNELPLVEADHTLPIAIQASGNVSQGGECAINQSRRRCAGPKVKYFADAHCKRIDRIELFYFGLSVGKCYFNVDKSTNIKVFCHLASNTLRIEHYNSNCLSKPFKYSEMPIGSCLPGPDDTSMAFSCE